ncbi:MAG: hypothetical protein RI894_176 [Bacteroidota bacterium]|jgi:hypothetical protein
MSVQSQQFAAFSWRFFGKASAISSTNFACLLPQKCVKFFAQRAALNSKFALFLNKTLREILAPLISPSFLMQMAVFIFPFATDSLAQNTDLPLGSPAYHTIDRLDIKSSGAIDPNFHTAQKAVSRIEAIDFLQKIDTALSSDLTAGDRADLTYFYKDNNLSLNKATEKCPDDPRYVKSKTPMPLIPFLYRTPANAIEVNAPHFAMNINPALQVEVGQELGTSPARYDYKNMKGVLLQMGIDSKVWVSTSLFDEQARFAAWRTRDIQERKFIPGNGYYKAFDSKTLKSIADDYDYLNGEGVVGVQASKHIRAQFGHGRNFIGDGYRSLFLSSEGNNYFYLKLNTKVWKFDYQNIFAELTRDIGTTGKIDSLLGKKYMAAHHLSYRPIKNLTLGVYEAVIFSRKDHFEFQYLNPIIFYRTVEGALGSPDNVLLGANAKFNFAKHCQLYGQVLLDEFRINEITNSRAWWGNKYAIQAGLKYIDIAKIDHLDAQIEYNMARPYTYSHHNSYADYTNYNQVLAHPLGANFQEIVGILRYQPLPNLLLKTTVLLQEVGKDSVSLTANGAFLDYTANGSFGANPMRSYYDRPIDPSTGNLKSYGVVQGQGFKSDIFSLTFTASYMLRHNLWVDAVFNRRVEKNPLPYYQSSMTYVGLGVRMNAFR